MENLKRFYINGEWVDPISDRTMEVTNPATEETIEMWPLFFSLK